MKIFPSNLLLVTLASFVLFLNFSCNKDSDLLAEYVVEENPIGTEPKEVIIDLANAVFTTDEDQPVSFNMLYNTSSNRKGRRRYKGSSKPKYGNITIEKDSIAVYTPSNDYNGKDDIEITLEVTNEDESTSEVVVAVEVTVEPVTDVVEDIVEITTEDPVVIEPLNNDTFNEESEVIITEVSEPKNGTAVINEDNTITYTPNTNNSEEVTPNEVPTEEVVTEEITTEEDTFTYTTSVTNPDNSVTEETGSVIVTDKTPSTEGPVEMGGLKAFPGAEGFGKNATGGRGGKVLFVTNLNDSGSGSFRAAVEAKGPRTVVFRVGGTINLTSNLTIDNDDITIAGETAPGDGILLKGDIFQVKANNVIIRYLRSRYGGSGQGTGDAMSVYASTRSISDIIFDHCSISWGGDENFNVRGNGNNIATDITLQNSIIAECGYGLLLYQGSNRVSIHRNLFAFNSDRNIRANYASGNNDLRYEMVNNLVYGFKNSPNNATLGIKYSLVNNKYKSSSSFSNNAKDVAISSNVDSGVSASWSYAFIEGNIHGGLGEYSSAVNPFLKSTPFDTSGLVESALNANELEGALLGHIGAGLSRDAVDNRIIDSYISGTGQLSGLGSYPTIKDGTPYTDTDNDGIEDSFEIANWGSLATNNTTDSDGDGYTNLEVFLHALTTK